MCKHAEIENGLHDLIEMMLQSMMVAERSEYLSGCSDGNFHPQILAILRDQEEECEKLAGTLYTKGLTQSQVGEVFDEIYGEHYSKAI